MINHDRIFFTSILFTHDLPNNTKKYLKKYLSNYYEQKIKIKQYNIIKLDIKIVIS